MGHREDLLEGAKKCLAEKGFVRTTARDIVSASGTNLASIGYHYGSKDALLTRAFIALMEEWGNGFQAGLEGSGGSLERFRALWGGVLDRYEESAPVWAASMEVALSGERMPELRTMLAASQAEGRRGLISMMTGTPEDELTERDVRTLGGFYQALLNGLMLQWIFDPESAATAEELTEGMRRAAGAAVAGGADGAAGGSAAAPDGSDG
ncbi:TetR/AcrR family transcriptional regulator [Streptomyces subrutilus]|uniref:TetR family transcriptional regulator n=1 Tax=Streptomyces subrutilus TaxID=36818 RepID=A0A5P2ULT4_9ACTN|nr:TetR/AcrR family transcriptional regulator [Streptomyces subrutilus]QEU78611.1 TetR/AcrR family transcriptional regulator [Streptomyces subrutilus]WSJ32226.1 TetR/AcrR family transcriptional regulator [Streptomyces subrutilus]GGZ59236.1 TetR family transcriptional regulator [Streptomyces subrutilus]